MEPQYHRAMWRRKGRAASPVQLQPNLHAPRVIRLRRDHAEICAVQIGGPDIEARAVKQIERFPSKIELEFFAERERLLPCSDSR